MGVLRQGTIVDRIDCNIQNVVASTMEERVKQTRKFQFSLSLRLAEAGMIAGLSLSPLISGLVELAVTCLVRLLIAIRVVALGLFLAWRIRHPNREAMWLWGMSITCEIWFAQSWILDQLPKLCPVHRVTDLSVLKERFESPNLRNPKGRSDLAGTGVFVSTADPEEEPPLVTANTILSILAVDYPVEKLACYLSDDGGSLLTFEALAETSSFARIWVPFCRKHKLEPRSPEAYFGLKREDRMHIMPMKSFELGNPTETEKVPRATWMSDGSHWPGAWDSGEADHSRGDHAGIIQAMLAPPNAEPVFGVEANGESLLDTTEIDIRLPMLVYVSREKRPGFDHNKKAGAMNALVRTSAIMSNGPSILNLDCDHYISNSLALREGMCFMLDRGGDRICHVQFPQQRMEFIASYLQSLFFWPVHSPITQCDLSSPLVGLLKVIGGTSAHPAAVLQGLLKVIAGFDISFTLTYKSATPEDGDDEFADLYVVKWSFLVVPPITIMILNLNVIAVGVARTMYSPFPQWSRLLGGVFFSFWVLSHLYPFAKGLMGRRGRVPTMFTFLGEHEVSVPLMKFSTSSMFSFLFILIHLLCTVRSFCACR
ncbi:hypothetical protein DKX38_003283 [Salix brachista]|uniref:Uncharacterized protein n=1 Tax=Salix brachista TaxID=2182728 RepID=A0A5N5NPE7_9ROSI|nr:hypothetical protein DKX38_003283 [Salix brachista]